MIVLRPYATEQERVDARDAQRARQERDEARRTCEPLTPDEIAAMIADCADADAAERALEESYRADFEHRWWRHDW